MGKKLPRVVFEGTSKLGYERKRYRIVQVSGMADGFVAEERKRDAAGGDRWVPFAIDTAREAVLIFGNIAVDKRSRRWRR